jgi:hypothetical protein
VVGLCSRWAAKCSPCSDPGVLTAGRDEFVASLRRQLLKAQPAGCFARPGTHPSSFCFRFLFLLSCCCRVCRQLHDGGGPLQHRMRRGGAEG